MRKILLFLPDIIIQLGILILAYNVFIHCGISISYNGLQEASRTEVCSGAGNFWGVALISVGLHIAIRRYINKRKKHESE